MSYPLIRQADSSGSDDIRQIDGSVQTRSVLTPTPEHTPQRIGYGFQTDTSATPSKTIAYTHAGSTRHEWEAMEDIADKKAIGARIKALRKARHWPQKQLANTVGIRYERLNNYEGGFSIPPAETLIRLADALGTTVDYLLTGTEIEESNLANIRLFRRFQALEHLAQEDQQTVIRLIDAFIAQQRIAAVLAPVD